MFPFSAIIGLAGQAASGIMSAVNNRKQAEAEKAAAARREAHYEAQAAENPLSRAENRALMGQYDRQAKKQVETARNMGTVLGATPEYAVAVQDSVAQGRADLMGNIAAANQSRVDKARENAEKAREAGEDAERARIVARNQTYATLAGNAANAAASIVDSYQTKSPSQTTMPSASAPSRAQMTTDATLSTLDRMAKNSKSAVEKTVYSDLAQAALKRAQGNAVPQTVQSTLPESVVVKKKQPWEV